MKCIIDYYISYWLIKMVNLYCHWWYFFTHLGRIFSAHISQYLMVAKAQNVDVFWVTLRHIDVNSLRVSTWVWRNKDDTVNFHHPHVVYPLRAWWLIMLHCSLSGLLSSATCLASFMASIHVVSLCTVFHQVVSQWPTFCSPSGVHVRAVSLWRSAFIFSIYWIIISFVRYVVIRYFYSNSGLVHLWLSFEPLYLNVIFILIS